MVIYEAGTAEVGDLLAIWRRCVATGAKLLLLGDRGNCCDRDGRCYLAGWAMVSITAAVARIRMSFSPGAISTP